MNDTMSEKKLPQHIAIVMDGNGRWAQERGLPRIAGHKEGLKAVRKIVKACAEMNIKILSLFAFSCENWQRPDQEVSFLMELFVQALNEEVQQLHEKGIKIRFIGERSAFSQELCECINATEELTFHNQGMQLVLAMNYGGQWDITQATQKIAQKVVNKECDITDITPEKIEEELATKDLAAPDLFIRTSGEKRMSNFFLWQIAYTELFFCDENWPDFEITGLQRAINWFSERKRRYGKILDQNIEKNDA